MSGLKQYLTERKKTVIWSLTGGVDYKKWSL